MKRRTPSIRTLVVAVAVLAATATTQVVDASAHGLSIVTIRHQMRGCHTWSFEGGPYRATLRVTVDAGRFVRFVNNDMMPHRLIQVSGPKVGIRGAKMNRIGAQARILVGQKGVYRFKTQAGKFFAWARRDTSGRDYVLRLTLVVK